jgi:hypothetical protein
MVVEVMTTLISGEFSWFLVTRRFPLVHTCRYNGNSVKEMLGPRLTSVI